MAAHDLVAGRPGLLAAMELHARANQEEDTCVSPEVLRLLRADLVALKADQQLDKLGIDALVSVLSVLDSTVCQVSKTIKK